MKLTEIERKCEEIHSFKEQLEAKRAELQKLITEDEERKKELQVLKIMAKVAGEKIEEKYGQDELKKAKKDIEDSEEDVKKLEQEVFEGLKTLSLNIPVGVIPKIDSSGKANINFEGDPCNNAVTFIASILSSDIPLKLDNVELYPDKIIVTNVQKPIQVAKALEIFLTNINCLARVALNEKDIDVEETTKYFYESPYRDIWEAIKGSKRITNQDLYSHLGFETAQERKKVRNFFTNVEIALKDKHPFIRLSKGTYELNFFGSLVWKRYQDKYLEGKEVVKESQQEASVETAIKNKEGKPRKSTLNRYLSNNKVKKIIYGKEVS